MFRKNGESEGLPKYLSKVFSSLANFGRDHNKAFSQRERERESNTWMTIIETEIGLVHHIA